MMAAPSDGDDGVVVTDKWGRVTHVYHEPRVTERAPERPNADAPALQRVAGELDVGQWIDDRYRIEEGPLGGDPTTEAEVYRCVDESANGEEVAVKWYRVQKQPKQAVLDQLLGLSHRHIVSLKRFGNDSNGRFFEVQEYCAGGLMLDSAPWSEASLRHYLPGLIEGLKYCHDRNIVHRDVKPNNLLFRAADRKELMLADFGISSILDSSERGVRRTSTQHLTPDYAAPELHTHSEVSPKTDYYGLGITLIHMLTGETPFAGMDKRAISFAHVQNKIPYPRSASPEFRQLLRGLTQLEPSNRWGYRQVSSWLKGEEVVDDQGRLWQDDVNVGSTRPYPGYPQARTPRELAAALEQFDAERELFRGNISKWVYWNYFGPELAKQIEEIEDNYTDRRELGLFKLRYVLDPQQPLPVGNHQVTTIRGLADLLVSDDEATLRALENVLWGEYLETWVDEVRPHKRSGELVGAIRSIHERLGERPKRLALVALLYTLDPDRPLPLSTEVAIAEPGELNDALVANPELVPEARHLIVTGAFEEWLTATAPLGWETDVEYIQDCRRRYAADERLQAYALLWRFCPSLPFPFGDDWLHRPEQLAQRLEVDDEAQRLALESLDQGWLRAWLVALGRVEPSALDRILSNGNADHAADLEAIVQALDSELSAPAVNCTSSALDFGRVSNETPKTRTLTIENTSRGYLYGALNLAHGDRGLRVDPIEFQGAPATIRITADTRGLPLGSRQETTLRIRTNGGDVAVPVRLTAAAPVGSMLGRSAIAGLVTGGALCVYRAVSSAAFGTAADEQFEWLTFDQALQQVNGAGANLPLASGWSIFALGMALIVAVPAAIYYTVRRGRRVG